MDQDAAIITRYLRDRHAGVGSLAAAIAGPSDGRAAVSIVLRGTDGYGLGRPLSSAPAVPPGENPPLTAIVVDASPQVGALLGEALLDETLPGERLPAGPLPAESWPAERPIGEPYPGERLTAPPLSGDAGGPTWPCLVTVERARLLTGMIDPLLLDASPGEATRLTIHCAQADRVYEVPAFEAACELLYRRGVAGATVLAGAEGTIGGRPLHPTFLRHGAGAPLMVVAVGSGERIGMLLPELGGMFRHPVMTLATVQLCKRDGQFVSRPESAAATAGVSGVTGMASLVRLSVYTSEAARHDGQPVHRAIIRRLRSAGIFGAVAQRGIWGFHGDHAPHGGDRFPLHARHVPVVTTVIDAPERTTVAFDVIDALTADRGLVTAETVQAPLPHAIAADQGT